MPRIKAKTQEVVVGITLNLTPDEATHLSYVLNAALDPGHHGAARKGTAWKNNWPWLKTFVEELDSKRGVGCTMGRRVINEQADTV